MLLRASQPLSSSEGLRRRSQRRLPGSAARWPLWRAASPGFQAAAGTGCSPLPSCWPACTWTVDSKRECVSALGQVGQRSHLTLQLSDALGQLGFCSFRQLRVEAPREALQAGLLVFPLDRKHPEKSGRWLSDPAAKASDCFSSWLPRSAGRPPWQRAESRPFGVVECTNWTTATSSRSACTCSAGNRAADMEPGGGSHRGLCPHRPLKILPPPLERERGRPYLALQLRHLSDAPRLQSLGQPMVQRRSGVLLRRLLVPNLQNQDAVSDPNLSQSAGQDTKQKPGDQEKRKERGREREKGGGGGGRCF